MGKLNALMVSRQLRAGMHFDGGGLYLQVGTGGAKSWIYRYVLHGRERYLGLGPANAIPLKRARELAARARQLRAEGIDPLDQKRNERLAAKVANAKAVTFDQCATAYMMAHEASWSNAKHRQQWSSTLATYVSPTIGVLPVQDIDTALVMKVVEPIWRTKPETASRVRGRIESILDWATVREYRLGDNPARWRGHLDKLLPAKSKVRTIEHHAALPYDQLPAFMTDLRRRESITARCLEFTILTAVRTGEAIGARWDELDLDAAIWTIPATRMKAGKEHRVPLAPRAVELLCGIERDGGFVFSARLGAPLSVMAMGRLVGLMGRDITVHGFRSSFRDWAAEQTATPHEVCEQALAHAIPNGVERAYRRGDLFEKRRQLMAAWAAFCGHTKM
jgi:integrase